MKTRLSLNWMELGLLVNLMGNYTIQVKKNKKKDIFLNQDVIFDNKKFFIKLYKQFYVFNTQINKKREKKIKIIIKKIVSRSKKERKSK